jgi:transposase-like protein
MEHGQLLAAHCHYQRQEKYGERRPAMAEQKSRQKAQSIMTSLPPNKAIKAKDTVRKMLGEIPFTAYCRRCKEEHLIWAEDVHDAFTRKFKCEKCGFITDFLNRK